MRAGVLGQAALSLADGLARVLLEKGLISQADYLRSYDLAVEEWEHAHSNPQQAEVLAALRRIRPAG